MACITSRESHVQTVDRGEISKMGLGSASIGPSLGRSRVELHRSYDRSEPEAD